MTNYEAAQDFSGACILKVTGGKISQMSKFWNDVRVSRGFGWA